MVCESIIEESPEMRFASVTLAFATLARAAEWSCTVLSSESLATGAVWSRSSCTSTKIPIWGAAGPVIVNYVDVDLNTPGLALMPLVAPAATLLPLDGIAAAAATAPRPVAAIAGINGGAWLAVAMIAPG